MVLSVIIVNYNVKHFLEQCLCSVSRAMGGMDAEVIVIDNLSTDGSIAYLQPQFPRFTFITNTENTGFARACNQGLQLATGRYILFLNPDTILPEDCFTACISFLEQRPDAGATGVKMLDGSGNFLKESKRAFPSPVTSLYKLFGLSRLFPRSPVFSKYHLGNLNENENHEVDVLAGAFMLIKKEVLNQTGGFDETFFMYGEDVDLSYRIQKTINPATGNTYKNYYFSDTPIIHFKGESTRKGSLNYVRMFYNAMSIFVRKHYGGRKAGLFNSLIHLAIWIRATMSAIGSFVRRIGLPVIDAGIILLSFWLVKDFWSQYVKAGVQYETKLLWTAFPAFTIAFLLTAYYAGLYDKWFKRSELISSTIIGTMVVLTSYALLPENFRFSRGIVLFGIILSFIIISLLRWLLLSLNVLTSIKEKEEHANTLIVASPAEYEEALQLMNEAGLEEKVLGRVSVQHDDSSGIGYWSKLNMLFETVPFREVVFCEGVLSFKNIIAALPALQNRIKVKIHASGSQSIVSSYSKDNSGEALSTEKRFKLSNPYNLRLKRLVDIAVSGIAIVSFPIHLLGVKKPGRFFINCFLVLFAKKTWVGYAAAEKNLPPLRPAVMACNGLPLSTKQTLPLQSLQMVDYWYARDYEPTGDIKLIVKMYRRLGG